MLGALECRSDGGFPAIAGCVAYANFHKLRLLCETPLPTFIPAHFKNLPCASTHLLGASKCFHKGGFPVRTGRVAYLSYASGLGVQGNALREVFSRAVITPCAVILGASKCRSGGGFASGTGRAAYLAYVSGLRHSRNAASTVLSRPVLRR